MEENNKEIEITMIRARLHERPEATMAQFLKGPNKDITNIFEL